MAVDYTTTDAVAIVTIDRPDVRNAVDGATSKELFDHFRQFDADDDLRVAVLTGAGGTFCAGADLKSISTGDDPNPVLRPPDGEVAASQGPMGPTRLQLTKPVIAAVEGHAVAGGLELAAWCDLRVAASDAVFGVYCRRWGVPLIDGGTVRLPRIVGHANALDMILTGRSVGAEEGSKIGLVNRVAEPGEALAVAVDLAKEIAGFPQTCMRADRASAIDQWSLDLDAALGHETDLGLEVLGSDEIVEGVSRFAQGAGRHGSF